MKELISVIIPNRKGEKNESLVSVKKQTYDNIEIIEIIDKDAKGASWARNQGLKKAKGEYLFYCDNDLELEPDCLENLYNTLQENKWADWAFGKFFIDNIPFNQNKPPMPENIYGKELIDYFHGISTMSLIRTKCNPKMDEELRRYDDWDLWIRLARAGHKPVFCDKFLFKTINRPTGISSGNDTKESMDKLYKKHLKKIADIVIPHHSQHEMLKNVLEKIDNKIFNIIIVSGGTFAENCNKGARLAETENIIFLNDDTEPTNEIFVKMIEDEGDITGIAQWIPCLRRTKYGIGFIPETFQRFLSDSPAETTIPSGFCFKVKAKVWKELGGLDEIFKNGAEDIDLFFRAMDRGYKFGYLIDKITHLLSQSENRFDYASENEVLLDKRWKKRMQKNLKKKGFIKEVETVVKDGARAVNEFYFQGRLIKKDEYLKLDEQSYSLLRSKGCVN